MGIFVTELIAKMKRVDANDELPKHERKTGKEYSRFITAGTYLYLCKKVDRRPKKTDSKSKKSDHWYWIFKIQHDGKRIERSLGPYGKLKLKDAREAARLKAEEFKTGLGTDAKIPDDPYFSDYATEFWRKRKKDTWTNEKHVNQWMSQMRSYAFPLIGAKKISSIRRRDILGILTPIWGEKPELARKLKQAIKSVFDDAIAFEIIDNNPATSLESALPKKPKGQGPKSFSSLDWRKIGEFLHQVELSNAYQVTKCLIWFSVYTGLRPGEARQTPYAEIDFARKKLLISGSRKKERRDFHLPLSTSAIRLIQRLSQFRSEDSKMLFPGIGKATILSENAANNVFKRLNIEGTAHGLRSTLATYGQEKGVNIEVIEHSLAHKFGGKLHAIYARHDYYEERKKFLEDWNTEVDKLYSVASGQPPHLPFIIDKST